MKKIPLFFIILMLLSGCSGEKTAAIDCEQYRAELVATYPEETIDEIFYSPKEEACLFAATKTQEKGYLKTLSNYSTNDILAHALIVNDEHENSIATKEFLFEGQVNSFREL